MNVKGVGDGTSIILSDMTVKLSCDYKWKHSQFISFPIVDT